MQDFDTLMPDILPHAIQCPEPTVIGAIRDALVELCNECRVWVVDDLFELQAEGPEIVFGPSGTLLVDIETIEHNGRELDPITTGDARRRLGAGWQNAAGNPQYYTQGQLNTLMVVPRNGGEQIALKAYLKPGQYTDCAPREVMQEYRLALKDGALAKIMELPNQPFSNPSLAAYHLQKFTQAKEHAYAKFLQGQQRAPLRVRGQFF